MKQRDLSTSIIHKQFTSSAIVMTMVELSHSITAIIDGLMTSRILGSTEMAAYGHEHGQGRVPHEHDANQLPAHRGLSALPRRAGRPGGGAGNKAHIRRRRRAMRRNPERFFNMQDFCDFFSKWVDNRHFIPYNSINLWRVREGQAR